MTIKARKRRTQKTRELIPMIGVDTEGFHCLVAQRSDDATAHPGAYFLTRMHPHYGHSCGHSHDEPELFGPFESRKEAQAFGQATFGVGDWAKARLDG